MLTYDDFENQVSGEEWHALYTIQLGELVSLGLVDFSSEEWDFDAYDDEQRERLWKKFYARNKYQEIGVVPPKRWQDTVLSRLNEIMPKYKPLYAALAEGYGPLQEGSERHRERYIRSEYPQTMLKPTAEDYASTGDERIYETIRDGSLADKAEQIARRYKDVDALVLDELDVFFIPLLTANVNGL